MTGDGSSPVVTVLIPARNEAADVERCLAAVLAQTHPHDRLEVVVVTGGSDDGTAAVAERALAGCDLRRAVVVDDAPGSTPGNLNAGLAASEGDLVCRVDARSIVPPEYVEVCAEVLVERADVEVVGGRQTAVPRGSGPVARGIARALNNRFGMGLARYRRGAPSGPADTVYLGAFRAATLRSVGGWNEDFPTNQDFELNRRLAARGLVWFDGRLTVGYLPRADLGALWRQYHRFGRWKVRYWRRTGDRPRPRQVVVMAGPALAVGVATVVAARRPRWVGPGAVAGAVAVVGVEVLGSRGDPARSPSEHGVAAAALAAVWSGWLSGIAREALDGRRR